MKMKTSSTLKSNLAVILMIVALLPTLSLRVKANRASKDNSSNNEHNDRRKIAPDLEESVNDANNKGKGNQMASVIIQLADDKVGISDSDLQEKFTRRNGLLKNRFNTVGLASAEIPLSRVADLMDDNDVAYISPDRPVVSYGHVETTVTAAQEDGRSEVTGITSLNGTGVGIAVLDSGIDDTHNLIKA